MALWGTADGIFSPGTVTVDFTDKTVTGSGTSFGAAGVSTGTVITFGADGIYGEAVISGVTSETYVSIASTQSIVNTSLVGVAYTLSQKPVYTLQDSNYAELPVGVGTINSVYGVSVYEAQTAINTPQKVAHAGWVGVHTYIDQHGNYRVKSEVLVAMSGITTSSGTYGAPGDAGDDSVFPDFLITIITQPTNRTGILTTNATTFVVVADIEPDATLAYQWEYASSVGAAYTALSNDLIYSNVATTTLGVAATTVTATRPDGFYYRVQVSANDAATVTSNVVELTYA
jgi:hypothetical protein